MWMKRLLWLVILVCFASFQPLPAFAQEKIHVAVAANFIRPFQEMASRFQTETGILVEATYSSTGQLYAQIKNGAPYDLFLAADQERPDLLHQQDLAEAPFVYATGRVIFWTRDKNLKGAGNWRKAIALADVRKIAIANPKTAPYGAAAIAAMEKAGLMELARGKLVFAQNIAQAFQYASTGSVDAGFCALSAALSAEGAQGYYLPVDEAPPIVQRACLLKRKADRKHAEKLSRFLFSEEAEAIKKKYGYY